MPIHQANSLLKTVLLAGGWRSDDASILEAFPHMSQELHPSELRQTLNNMRIPFSEVRCRETDITTAECPAIVIPDDGSVYVVLDQTTDGLVIENAGQQSRKTHRATRRMVQVLRIEPHQRQKADQRATNVFDTLGALRPMLPWLILASFLTNVLGLLTPLLIMAIYDRVIPASSVYLLLSMAIGVCVVLATDFSLRSARSLAIAHVGRRVEQELSIALFRKFMALPLPQLQKSDVSQQMSRFRQFEALRDVFTGQVMSSLLDLPFALIFLAVLMYISVPVGVLTLCVVVFFAVLSCVAIPIQRRLDAKANEASEASTAVLQDAIKHQSAIANLGLAQTWRMRSAPLTEAAERSTRRARQFQTSMQSLVQTATALATVAAIVLSAKAALVGDLSFGGLIAVIALVSKVIAPLHALNSNIPQILMFLKSQKQADRVLGLTEEFELGHAVSHQKSLGGAVRFTGVTYRPDPLTSPLLNQVSFTSKPGELVLVMGSVTSRSALIDLIGGLHVAQAGTIEMDNIDIRQIARDELRRSVTSARQNSAFFYGTVAQNFRLGSATLTDAEINAALAEVGLIGDLEDLPDGLQTRLRDDAASTFPEHRLKALSLARSIARSAPIHLFADPTEGLNSQGRDGFKKWAARQKGTRTVYVATSDRSFMQFADRFLFFDEGRLVVNDTGPQGLKKIMAVLNNLEEKL
ncbi:peptidase domain-containing ABC transporter [Algirhabdus cladophorae]|uniref:peptidase domain-containing ABC transporter n=1 Tax=Algirhabdus cladophorae TaxID=3377108 RepID=UPI003B84AFF4